MVVRTRFAPSPTGYFHIGGVRTALFSWLYARHCGGKFLLRIEDTDRERSTPEAIAVILQGMTWLELNWDEGPFYQTQRMDRYREAIRQLLDAGRAYPCWCSKEELEAMRQEAMARGAKPKYNGRCRDRSAPPPGNTTPVVRFKNPLDGEVVVNDLIQGRVVYANSELDDLIIARPDGVPTYNFSVVVDDLDMRITHVIRGDDHLNNAPRQINILHAFGAEPPLYAHVPLILAPDGKKLSKRHGTVSVLQYRDDGYLPEAMLNYLVRLGWSHGDQEIFSMQEMIESFDVRDVNKAAAAINPEKLLWLNQHYIKTADAKRLAGLIRPHLLELGLDPRNGPDLAELVTVQRERTSTLRDMAAQSHMFFADLEKFDEQAAAKHLKPEMRQPLGTLRERFALLGEWRPQPLRQLIEAVAAECGMKLGKLAQPLRVAVTGYGVSPSIEQTLYLLGRERSLRNLDRSLAFIQGHPL